MAQEMTGNFPPVHLGKIGGSFLYTHLPSPQETQKNPADR
jgi:hypothetical protein